MTILAAVHWRQEKLTAWWRAYPLTHAGPAAERSLRVSGKAIVMSRRPRSATTRPFARLSQTSLVLVLTLFTVWAAVVVSASLERKLELGRGIHHTSKPGDSAPED
jgi:hypothetical protein